MPVVNTSRYFGLPIYNATVADGTSAPTVPARPPTPPGPGVMLYRHRVTAPETLESIAFRYYGSSDAWWRIAEANDIFFLTDLPAGTLLNIPAAGDIGRVVRRRRF
jgi:nucleoid-associated protein YgaU